MTDSTWQELDFAPHAMRYRWRHEGVNPDGYLMRLEIERWRKEIEEWVPVKNYNVLDFFRMGFREARKMGGQTDLGL